MKKALPLLLMIFLFSCKKEERLIQKHYFIFGTVIDVLIWHSDNEKANKSFVAVEKTLNAMHNQWHAWKPSRLTEMNAALRAEKPFIITDEEASFILKTKRLSLQSHGHFNPAIGELINLWGFHTDTYPITTAPPSKSQINDFVSHLPTMNNLTITNNRISSNNPRIWLDYGGVAKGYAIDKAINNLKSHGIKNAIVNAGGDLRSIGSKGKNNWRVAIRKPNSEEVLAVIAVKEDESIFTSGNYERYKEFNGKRYTHIINPKTGFGVNQIISATVIAENGTKADAAATAMIVSDKDNWSTITKSMHLNQVLLIDEDGSCFASEKIIPRLENSVLECKIIPN